MSSPGREASRPLSRIVIRFALPRRPILRIEFLVCTTVIGECLPRHRHREFLRFLKTIDQQTAPHLDLHLIVDNYATHKTPAVKRWLKRHPRFHLHFTPTAGSWLNMVERFFGEISRKRIRRGAFNSVAELEQAIMDYLKNHNADPKPYVWTKSAAKIFQKIARAKQALESLH